MITILNEHFLILSSLIILCFGIIYRFATHLNFPSINSAITILSLLALFSTLTIIIIDFPVHTVLYNSLFVKDRTTFLIEVLTTILFMGTIMTTLFYNKKEQIAQFEYIILVLFVLISIHLLVAVEEIFAFYLILEFQSICLYVLASLKKNKYSIEAAIKYFVIGSFSSIILLLGFSFLYGITGLTHFENLAIYFSNINQLANVNMLVSVSIMLISIGFFFKVYLVPMHVWVSDIYAQAPTSSVIIFSTSSLLPFFFILYKMYAHILFNFSWFWKPFLLIMCVLSILIGTIGALYQYSIKRLLAYSSITNSGYVFLSFLFYESPFLMSNGILYLIIYTLNTFGILTLINSIRFKNETSENSLENIYQLQGVYKKNRILSYYFMYYFYAVAGIPPFSFFFSKIYLFTSLLYKNEYIWLVIIIAFATVTAVYYYIRIIQIIYFNETEHDYSISNIPFSVSYVNYIITLINCIFIFNTKDVLSVMQYMSLDLYI